MFRVIAATAVMAFGIIGPASAQDFPNKTVRFIVPFAPGGGTDSTGRIAAEALTQRLGAPVVVENKAGAGTGVGIDYVAKSKNDGYTLAWATSDSFSILPAVKPGVPFRILEDFEYVATTSKYSVMLAVNAKLPFKTLHELIAYGKANPGKLRYSSAGVGGGSHLAADRQDRRDRASAHPLSGLRARDDERDRRPCRYRARGARLDQAAYRFRRLAGVGLHRRHAAFPIPGCADFDRSRAAGRRDTL